MIQRKEYSAGAVKCLSGSWSFVRQWDCLPSEKLRCGKEAESRLAS